MVPLLISLAVFVGVAALIGGLLGLGAFSGLGVLVGLSMYLPFAYIATYGVGCVINMVVGKIKGASWARASSARRTRARSRCWSARRGTSARRCSSADVTGAI